MKHSFIQKNIMDDKSSYNKAIYQKHIVEKIMSDMSFSDCYNLSKVSKSSLIASGLVKKKGMKFSWRSNDCESKIFSHRLRKRYAINVKYNDPKNDYFTSDKNKKEIKQNEDKKLSSDDAFKESCRKLNEFLDKKKYTQNLIFNSNWLPENKNFDDAIKNIKNCNVPEVTFIISECPFIKISMKNIVTFSDTSFNGFTNLKKIKFHVESLINCNLHKRIIDVATKIGGITVEVKHLNSIKSMCHFDNELADESNLLTYILKKKLNLLVPKHYFDIFNFIDWVRKLDTADLAYLKRFCLLITTIHRFRQLSTFLPYMTNLQWLELRFRIQIFALLVEYNTLKLLQRSKEHLHESFKNLKNLETINIAFTVYPKDFELIDSFWIVLINGQLIDSRELFENEFFSFLSQAPDCVKNLYISGMSNLTSDRTLMLSNTFPNLTFLFLKNIYKSEKESLMVFKNLKNFSCCNTLPLDLPKSVSICVILYKDDLPILGISLQRYDSCCYYQMDVNNFTKESILQGDLNGKIFFNYFHQLYHADKYFSNINEFISMIQD